MTHISNSHFVVVLGSSLGWGKYSPHFAKILISLRNIDECVIDFMLERHNELDCEIKLT
jgi:hypothetical protein